MGVSLVEKKKNEYIETLHVQQSIAMDFWILSVLLQRSSTSPPDMLQQLSSDSSQKTFHRASKLSAWSGGEGGYGLLL